MSFNLSPQQRRIVTAYAAVDDRALRRFLADPTAVRSTTRFRIEGALRELGFLVDTPPYVRVGRSAR